MDEKGRIVLPTKFRNALGEGSVLTVWIGPSLLLIPGSSWSLWEGRLERLPLADVHSNRFKRFFYSNMIDIEPDRSGRILIPRNLSKWAHIEKEVVVNGLTTQVEIWAAERWSAYMASPEKWFEEDAKVLDSMP